MGRLRIKKEKDWRAKFREPDPSGSLDKLALESLSASDIMKERLDETSSEPVHEGLSLQERSLYLLDAAKNILDVPKAKWADIRRTISGEQVRELYQVISDLWHPKTDIGSLMPAPSSDLRAMYCGNRAPDVS